MEQDTTLDTLPEELDVSSPDGNEAVDPGEDISPIASIKDVLSETLGKDFPDDETALKAVKDTFSHVGKTGQEIKKLKEQLNSANPSNERLDTLERQLRDANFYAENPQYKPYKDVIDETGKTPEEYVKSAVGKRVLDGLMAHDETEKSKSVLQSNARLGTVTDKMSQAREALSKGDVASAKNDAVKGVMEAFDM